MYQLMAAMRKHIGPSKSKPNKAPRVELKLTFLHNLAVVIRRKHRNSRAPASFPVSFNGGSVYLAGSRSQPCSWRCVNA